MYYMVKRGGKLESKYVLDTSTIAVLNFVNQNGEPFSYDLKQELAFSDATLMLDMEAQPAKYAWWTSILERARIKMKHSEDNLDYVRATISNQVRAEGSVKTVAAVTDAVIVNASYQSALAELRYWQGEVDMLVYVVKSFEQRERMLMQKSAQLRKSLANDASRPMM